MKKQSGQAPLQSDFSTALGVKRQVLLSFDGERVCSDGGLPILSALGRRIGLWDSLSRCLSPLAGRVRHERSRMAMQRVLGICCGYEDCNDFDTLRYDPLFDLSTSLKGALASQPTLCRFENCVTEEEVQALSRELVEVCLRRRKKAPRRVVIDLDATDDPTYGQQEFAFYNVHSGGDCYIAQLATLALDGSRAELVWADLRPGNHGASRDSADLVEFLVSRLRAHFPKVKILVRADGAYPVPTLLAMCESLKVQYVIGFGDDPQSQVQSEPFKARARLLYRAGDTHARVYGEFQRRTKSWKSERRIVCKAWFDGKEDKVRYVVTSLKGRPRDVYKVYCGRGDMENRIKDMKLDLYSGRTSCHGYTANRFRLALHAFAYVLLDALRKMLEGTELEDARLGTLRLRLVKVAALVRKTTRRIFIRFAKANPWHDHLKLAIQLLT